MRKYKQTEIPGITIGERLKVAKRYELSKISGEYYNEYLRGKSVVTNDKGFTISFTGAGRNKVRKGSTLYPKKVAVLKILDKVLKVAEYSNFGQPKKNDPQELMGYLNFKAKVKIDNKIETVRIACLFYSADKIFWNHEINIVKK